MAVGQETEESSCIKQNSSRHAALNSLGLKKDTPARRCGAHDACGEKKPPHDAQKCLHTAMGYLYNRNESRPGVLLPRRIRPESAPNAANPKGLQVAARLTWSNQRFEQVTSWRRLVSCGASCNPQRIAEEHPSNLTNSAQRGRNPFGISGRKATVPVKSKI